MMGRASYKRILYGVLAWTCICLVVLKVDRNFVPSSTTSSVSSPNSGAAPILNILGEPDGGDPSTSLTSHQRGLQNHPVDYSAVERASSDREVEFLPNQLMQDPEDITAIKVDNSPPPSEGEVLLGLTRDSSSNLPITFWAKMKKEGRVAKKSATVVSSSTLNNSSPSPPAICKPEYPNLYELEYNNIYWQQFNSNQGNGTFFLYGAYYDDRWRGGPMPSVRILAMIDRVSPPPVLCQLWFNELSGPIISPVTYIYGWYPKWGNYVDGKLQPFVMTCKVPRMKGLPRMLVPASVSLVDLNYNFAPCKKVTNNLRVRNDRPENKGKFAVCVKGLDFLHEDLSVRLVEWIEMLRILGAGKIFLYDMEVHPNITKVLDYYQQEGIVERTQITLPGNQPNLPGFRHLYLKNRLTEKRQNELIPYNDCLYRNLYSYQYLALLDIDEVIMPIAHETWTELMQQVQKESLKEKNYTRASYNVRNVYFLDSVTDDENPDRTTIGNPDGIPKYLHMLQHVYRSRNYTQPGQYVKCFHNTERVVTLHNHFPLNCFGTCTTYSINISLAQLQHYRKDCVGPLKKSCKDFRDNTVRDETIWKYKDSLIAASKSVLVKLGFLPPSTP